MSDVAIVKLAGTEIGLAVLSSDKNGRNYFYDMPSLKEGVPAEFVKNESGVYYP